MSTPAPGECLIVLDTNVALDLFHFDDAGTRPLADALAAGRLVAALSTATREEWRRVLAYPRLGLDAAAQVRCAARYDAVSRLHAAAVPTGLPRCRDADDQKFLELAASLGAPLVSKDHALLELARRRCPVSILTPKAAAAWVDAGMPGCATWP